MRILLLALSLGAATQILGDGYAAFVLEQAGENYADKGYPREALDCFGRALAEGGDGLTGLAARLGRARVLSQLKRWEEAEKALVGCEAAARELGPEGAWAHSGILLSRARCALELGRPSDCLRALRAWDKIRDPGAANYPSDAAWRFTLEGDLLFRQGRLKEAAQIYREGREQAGRAWGSLWSLPVELDLRLALVEARLHGVQAAAPWLASARTSLASPSALPRVLETLGVRRSPRGFRASEWKTADSDELLAGLEASR